MGSRAGLGGRRVRRRRSSLSVAAQSVSVPTVSSSGLKSLCRLRGLLSPSLAPVQLMATDPWHLGSISHFRWNLPTTLGE